MAGKSVSFSSGRAACTVGDGEESKTMNLSPPARCSYGRRPILAQAAYLRNPDVLEGLPSEAANGVAHEIHLLIDALAHVAGLQMYP